MSKLFLEILDADREKIFNQLSAFANKGILAGGTALTLQIGHRKSFDFDIFVPKSISHHFVKKVVEVFGQDIEIRHQTGDILLVKTPKNIEVHFIYYWYQNLFKTIKTSSIDLFAVGDIAADKAHTIGRRGQWRDYVDIFFLLKRKIYTLDAIIKMATQKFRPEFNPRLFLEQLCYYRDIQDFSITFVNESYPTKEIKDYLKNEVNNFKQNNFFQF